MGGGAVGFPGGEMIAAPGDIGRRCGPARRTIMAWNRRCNAGSCGGRTFGLARTGMNGSTGPQPHQA